MKTITLKQYTLTLIAILATFTLLVSCEQTGVEPQLNAAPGGGTLSAYRAYELKPATADNVYGRVVFWRDNANNTLVQISLYNTTEDSAYPSGIYKGSEAVPAAKLLELYNIDGTTGEFGTSKFYVIGDKNFYESLKALDAHIRIMAGSTLVASGNVGKNTKPVASEGDPEEE